MKRILAWNCLAFVAAQAAAAFLGQTVVLIALGALAAFALLMRQNTRARICFALAASFLLGAGWSCVYTAGHQRLAETLDGTTVSAAAEVRAANPAYGNSAYGTLRLEIDGVPSGVSVSCYGFPALEPGQRFQADFALTKVEKERLSHYADGIFLTAEYHGSFSPLEPGKSLFSLFAGVRMKLSSALRSRMDDEKGALVSAMALGDKSRLTAGLRGIFASAGASHMLVVSGMHLAMLCGVLSGIMQLGMFSRKRACLLAAVALLMVGLVGATVSVVRAATVLLFSCLGLLAVRKADILTSLSVSALLICIQCPYAMFDVSFQLTYSATLGVIAAVRLYNFYVHQNRKAGETQRLPRWKKRLLRLRDDLPTALLTGIFATLFTAPFLLLHRMAVSGVSMFSSVLAMILLPGILLLGIAAAIAGCLKIDLLAAVLIKPLSLLLDILLAALRLLGTLPFARLPLPREYTIFALLVIAVWACAMIKWKHTRYFPAKLLAVMLAAVLLGYGFGRDVIEAEEFGNASAPCVLVTQNGHSMLLYRGGLSNRSQLQRLLDYRGLTRPELVIDLRQSASSEPPEAETMLLAMELKEPTEGRLTEDISYYLLPEKKGSLVLLDLGGYRLAMTAGELKENREIPADAYFSAGKKAFQINSVKIIVNNRGYSWLEDTPENVYYGANPVVSVRPGKSIRFKGVKAIAVQ